MPPPVRQYAGSSLPARLVAAHASRNWQQLTKLCRQVLRYNPRDLQAHRLLGFALQQQDHMPAALHAFEAATKHHPEDGELLLDYANVLLQLGQAGRARALLETMVLLHPDSAMPWIMLAQSCYGVADNHRGFEAAQRALALAGADNAVRAAALNQCALHRREQGQVREAVRDCEAAIALMPQDFATYANCLLFMLADPERNVRDFMRVGRALAEAYEKPLRQHWPRFEDVQHQPWRRLRIGFVSPDFRDHAVMYFIEGLLAQLDRRMFEVVAFYLHPVEDAVTARVKCHVDHFIPLAGKTPVEQATAIRAARIDIAIDLAGHTGYSGLPALAYKPAPVQVSWLGFPATTGLSSIDYKFTDEVTDAEGADDEYVERLYRLPTLFCSYRPLIRAPLYRYQPRYLVRRAPALDNGYVTFGSCNNLGKLTDEVLALWGRILRAVPTARLLIEGKGLGETASADAYRQRCAGLGVDPERLFLVGLDRRNQYLTYHRIDIALDPFPLTGGTTTFDVLWMGVPLVSMVGASFKSRLSTSILAYLGRAEWLAQDADDYVRIAQELAQEPRQLNALRLGLRQEVEQSALMREDLHTHHFGEGLRVMWLQWLAERQHPNDAPAQQQVMHDWLRDVPPEWATAPVPGVGVAPGERIPLPQAHARLQALVDQAKAEPPPEGQNIVSPSWIALTELAETVLCAVPHDPMALACLAEVEQAHGHADFAMTYLHYATKALALQH
ncbi:Predicted O-linked N-acetylglucosamine transferase, SPINDLY family [Oryzisolibacter propanilivorax]|uniref:protein O-GlcNAc transferase n=1 Tax=Oryzisolibacter propanilivorax TaxID=1527607 RepID=A0A1G9V454_9BURK|nr:tetratricopeptide repeat protein [Oryzisolibacter propanilivorax]SDM67021.1 Predicted O-linked N-acetylglucosamine transferase, SPINDLY family [Oryzisolibacter propanilivorax]